MARDYVERQHDYRWLAPGVKTVPTYVGTIRVNHWHRFDKITSKTDLFKGEAFHKDIRKKNRKKDKNKTEMGEMTSVSHWCRKAAEEKKPCCCWNYNIHLSGKIQASTTLSTYSEDSGTQLGAMRPCFNSSRDKGNIEVKQSWSLILYVLKGRIMYFPDSKILHYN